MVPPTKKIRCPAISSNRHTRCSDERGANLQRVQKNAARIDERTITNSIVGHTRAAEKQSAMNAAQDYGRTMRAMRRLAPGTMSGESRVASPPSPNMRVEAPPGRGCPDFYLGQREFYYDLSDYTTGPVSAVGFDEDLYVGINANGGAVRIVSLSAPGTDSVWGDTGTFFDTEYVTTYSNALYLVDRSFAGGRVYNITSGTSILYATSPNPTFGVVFSPDGRMWSTGFSQFVEEFDASGNWTMTHTVGTVFTDLGHGGFIGDTLYMGDLNSSFIYAFNTSTLEVSTFNVPLYTDDYMGEFIVCVLNRIFWSMRFGGPNSGAIFSCLPEGNDFRIEYGPDPTFEPMVLSVVDQFMYVPDFDGYIYRFPLKCRGY